MFKRHKELFDLLLRQVMLELGSFEMLLFVYIFIV